jgi:fermentation-respiration switch protein FrsA (DUF1100 family)
MTAGAQGGSQKKLISAARTSVLIQAEEVNGVPVLHAAPVADFDKPLPTIFFLHSFRVSKELISYFGWMLGAAGFRVVMPEAPDHGERFSGDDARRLRSFWDILRQSVDELPHLRESYASRGLIRNEERIGVAGTSMGAFAALSAATRYPWIGAAASLMGTGYFLDAARTIFPPMGAFTPEKREAHHQRLAQMADYQIVPRLDRLAALPLYIWHGERDDVVPYADAIRLQDDILAAGGGDRLEFLSDPFGGHKVTMNAASGTVSFFSRWMNKDLDQKIIS